MASSSSNPDFLGHFSSAVPGSQYAQRTFLGSSITKFSLSAGFGDTSTTMGIDLVDDVRNTSDGTPLGLGQDVYHNGIRDQFAPPPVGSPVFFAFGKQYPTVNESFQKTFDGIYGGNYAGLGSDDFAYGGILQAYNQTRSTAGNPLYQVQITDPREILSNTEIILRNYAGSVYGTPNMFNVYGFLEYNALTQPDSFMYSADPLTRHDNGYGDVSYSGTDMYYRIGTDISYASSLGFSNPSVLTGGEPTVFPMTGTGFSRVGPQGIPYYRIIQALNAMMGWNGFMPTEYVDAGFTSTVNFRGFNYIIDLTGVPLINQFYYFDYDKMSLMDFLLEACEITSHELVVSLLPVINHPACQGFYNFNNSIYANPSNMIFGIIRVDAIDKTAAQTPGAIKSYLDSNYDGSATSTDLGVELSNVVTDKFVTGAQETEMHFFSTLDDRTDEPNNSWSLERTLEQQAIPYYGTLRSGAVTIPKGVGSYQQILLDASQLYAEGVGDYYVTTEMELRASLVSFERWRDFLLYYNNLYMESTEDNDLEEGAALEASVPTPGHRDSYSLSNNYAVTVPRCVWNNPNAEYAADGNPVDGCFPPYGYPLYFNRANRIGINQAGYGSTNQSHVRIISTLAALKGADPDNFQAVLESLWQQIQDADEGWNAKRTVAEQEFVNYVEGLIKSIKDGGDVDKANIISFLEDRVNKLKAPVALANQVSKRLLKNAQKVYNFVRTIAQENLGKKYLVKIPKLVNPYYQGNVTRTNGRLLGPFGFKPWPLNNDPRDLTSASFIQQVDDAQKLGTGASTIKSMLSTNYGYNPTGFSNNLVINYNPITNSYVSNYKPQPLGGWAPFELSSAGTANAVAQGLFPASPEPVINSNSQRIECYVKFDNSQDLSFGSVPRNSFTQQAVVAGQYVPDLNYQLDNTTNGSPASIAPDNPALSGPKSIAFVKATVSPELYFAPVVGIANTAVHGRDVVDIGSDSLPKRIFNCETGEYDNSFSIHRAQFVPRPINTQTDAFGTKNTSNNAVVKVEYVLDGSESDQRLKDSDHVYVLVTLPALISAEIDSRFRDGSLQEFNTEDIKHAMGQDVVRGVAGFDAPGIVGTPTDIIDKLNLEPIPLSARNAIKVARSKLAYALPQQLEALAPSPVIPDLFVIPLENQERTYGPWSSSTVGTSVDIGGNVEYSKDENLAPWNYGGYDLMNQAGLLQAEFSNSLMLASERGSFSVPDIPRGVGIAQFLTQGGPLVTNITVSVDTQGGVKSQYTMDLYTSSFGKLQKQKENAIAKINRDRQKAIDERNKNIRNGIAKSQVGNSEAIAEAIKNASVFATEKKEEGKWSSPGMSSPSTTKVVSAVSTPNKTSKVQGGSGLDAATAPETEQSTTMAGAVMSPDGVAEISDKFADMSQSGSAAYMSAASDVGEDETGFTNSPRHKAFPAKKNTQLAVKNSVYGDGFDDEITTTRNT